MAAKIADKGGRVADGREETGGAKRAAEPVTHVTVCRCVRACVRACVSVCVTYARLGLRGNKERIRE